MWGTGGPREPCALLAGREPNRASVDDSREVPQKMKKTSTIGSSNPFSGNISEENKSLSQWDICMPKFTAALFTTAETCEAPECPSTHRRMPKEVLASHRMSCSLKNNGIHVNYKKNEETMPFETMWMTLEVITLSEINQQRKTNIVWSRLYVES